MKTIENFILKHDGQQKAIVTFLHHHLSTYHDLDSKINWNIPTYYRRSWVCYLNPIKNQGIELAFFHGTQLSNEQGILKTKGRKQVAGIDLFKVAEIDQAAINEIVQEAIILDDLSKN